MKPALLFALLAMTLTPALAQQTAPAPEIGTEPDFIFIQEIHLWTALQARDLATFQPLLLPDFIQVERTIQTRDQVMENLNICTLVSFHLHNHQLRTLSPDAVVIAYSGTSEINCGESHLSGNYLATTTWVRRDGKWFAQVHTEIPTTKP